MQIPEYKIDLASLQHSFAMVDMLNRPRRSAPFGVLEQLVIKTDQIKIKMYQEKQHMRPHFHIDYGSRKHAASYAIDTGKRLEGTLSTKYDKAVVAWVGANRDQLQKVWDAIQSGAPEQPFIQSLSAMEL